MLHVAIRLISSDTAFKTRTLEFTTRVVLEVPSCLAKGIP